MATKTTKTAAAAPAKANEDVITVHREAIESSIKTSAESAATSVEQAVALIQEQSTAAVEAGTAALKGYEDLFQFSKENVEAFVESGNVVVRGVQDLSKTFVTMAQESIDEQVAASRALIGAKSFKDVIDVSSNLAKTNFEKLVAESTRITQLSTKLAEEAFAPLSGRVNAAMERLTKTAA